FIGGMLRWMVDRLARRSAAEGEMSPGTLLATGYIAGGTIGAVVYGFMNFSNELTNRVDLTKHFGPAWIASNWPAVVAFIVLIGILARIGMRRFSAPARSPGQPGVER